MIDVKEFAVIECIEVTGSYRIVSLELAEFEEVVLETDEFTGSLITPMNLTDQEINDMVEHGIVPSRKEKS